MKKSYLLYILTGVLLLLTTYFAIFLLSKKENSVADYSVLSIVKPIELQSEGFMLSPDYILSDESGNLMKFNDIFGSDSSIIVYRFSEMHCDLCVEQHFSILKDLSREIDLSKLVFLSAFSSTKKMKMARQVNSLDFRIYNAKDNLGIPLENISTPYFFILDKDLKCSSFFTAIKENPELTIIGIKTLAKIIK
jgi:hypothetical protein